MGRGQWRHSSRFTNSAIAFMDGSEPSIINSSGRERIFPFSGRIFKIRGTSGRPGC